MSSHRPPKGSRLQQAWLHRGWLAWLLWPISLLMRLIVALRRQAFAWGLLRSEHPGVPVIVVGNVVAGGGRQDTHGDCRRAPPAGMRPASRRHLARLRPARR
jgi:hypothetical protein